MADNTGLFIGLGLLLLFGGGLGQAAAPPALLALSPQPKTTADPIVLAPTLANPQFPSPVVGASGIVQGVAVNPPTSGSSGVPPTVSAAPSGALVQPGAQLPVFSSTAPPTVNPRSPVGGVLTAPTAIRTIPLSPPPSLSAAPVGVPQRESNWFAPAPAAVGGPLVTQGNLADILVATGGNVPILESAVPPGANVPISAGSPVSSGYNPALSYITPPSPGMSIPSGTDADGNTIVSTQVAIPGGETQTISITVPVNITPDQANQAISDASFSLRTYPPGDPLWLLNQGIIQAYGAVASGAISQQTSPLLAQDLSVYAAAGPLDPFA